MLNPYKLTTPNINGNIQSGYSAAREKYPNGTGYDKQAQGNDRGYTGDLIKTGADYIQNILGTRSPMYTIGELPADNLVNRYSHYLPDEINGLVRAVENTVGNVLDAVGLEGAAKIFKNQQEGVIIDGIGDVSGTHEVDFSSNPNVFKTDQIVNNRIRRPSKLTMTIYVSNYNNDDTTASYFDRWGQLHPDWAEGINLGKNLIYYGGYTRAQYALYKLRWLMENGKPFTVYTPHGIYDNMLIKTIRPYTTDKTMDMLYCDLEFEEIIFYAPYSSTIGTQPARVGIAKSQTVLETATSKNTYETVAKWLKL